MTFTLSHLQFLCVCLSQMNNNASTKTMENSLRLSHTFGRTKPTRMQNFSFTTIHQGCLGLVPLKSHQPSAIDFSRKNKSILRCNKSRLQPNLNNLNDSLTFLISKKYYLFFYLNSKKDRDVFFDSKSSQEETLDLDY